MIEINAAEILSTNGLADQMLLIATNEAKGAGRMMTPVPNQRPIYCKEEGTIRRGMLSARKLPQLELGNQSIVPHRSALKRAGRAVFPQAKPLNGEECSR